MKSVKVNRTLLAVSLVLIAATAKAGVPATSATRHVYNTTFGFDYHDAAGDGNSVRGTTYTAKAVENLSGGRSQYFLLSYDASNMHIDTVYDSVKSATLAYGQVWKQPQFPNLVFNLGGFYTHSNNDYGASLVNDSYVMNDTIGVTGGVARVFVKSPVDTILTGSNFVVSVHEGPVVTAYPYVEYKHQYTPKLAASVRLAGVASTRDANIHGSNFSFQPGVGFDYAVDDYKIAVKYSQEVFVQQRSNRIGFTVSKPF